MAAGLEAEKAVPVTEVQDHSRQRDLFNLAGIAHDEAHFDKMVVLVTRHGCDPNARNTAANYHYTPMHQAGEPRPELVPTSRAAADTLAPATLGA